MRPNEVLKKLPVSVITLQGEALVLYSPQGDISNK
jgi:hypothetical protein